MHLSHFIHAAGKKKHTYIFVFLTQEKKRMMSSILPFLNILYVNPSYCKCLIYVVQHFSFLLNIKPLLKTPNF